MYRLLAITLFFSASLAHAELYKSIGEDGEVIYTDKPPTKDAKAFTPPALQVTPPIKYVPKAKPPAESKAPPYAYSDLHFSQPVADANFYDNAGNVSYVLELTPVLNTRLGHYLNIKLDGAAVASKTVLLTGNLSELDRGSHTITAEIFNKEGKVQRSASVTFHLHKTSVPPPTPPPPPKPKP